MRLEDWFKRLEEQEQAVLGILESGKEGDDAADAGDRPVDTTRSAPLPVPTIEDLPGVGCSACAEVDASVGTTEIPGDVDSTLDINAARLGADAASIESLVRLRKKLPEQILLPYGGEAEVAQNSYKKFKETREELLQRLLDPQISLEDAARILNVCPTTVRRYTNRGLLPHFRTPGNQRRFRLSDVLALLESQAFADIRDGDGDAD